METRKLIKSGPSTLSVTLPKHWLKSQNLKKGDIVDVEIFINKLVISPYGKIKETSMFIIDLNVYGKYYELLIFAGFLSDKKEIIIKNIKSFQHKKIIKIIRKLSYLKIDEETEDSLKLIFIADPNMIDIKKELNNIKYNLRNFFKILLNKKIDFVEADAIYEQLSLQVMILIKLLKIKFLEYNKTEIIIYKQLIDSYYFFIKNCKEFMVFSKKLKISNREYGNLIHEGLDYLEQILKNIEKKDLLKILEIQEKIQTIRNSIFGKMQKNISPKNHEHLLLIGEIFKIIENMGYAYINNQ